VELLVCDELEVLDDNSELLVDEDPPNGEAISTISLLVLVEDRGLEIVEKVLGADIVKKVVDDVELLC